MFKAIEGYEGIYEVSDLGEVRSVDRIVEFKDGRNAHYKGKVLKLAMNVHGYFTVMLSKNGITKMMTVHRLVAEAFLPNPENLPEVHHINHVKTDNRACNLKWVTRAEQFDDHWRAAHAKAQGTRLRVVGNGIDRIFISSHEVARELGVSQGNVSMVANGIRKQTKGYKIYFAD